MQAVGVMVRRVRCLQVEGRPRFARRRSRFALFAALVCASAWALPSTANAQNGAPVIDAFTSYSIAGDLWGFTGHVTDENPAGCTLILSGAPLAGPALVEVQPNGSFTAILQILAAGTVWADATDAGGLQAEPVGTIVGY
ncbi:MAG: hypothetical protein HYS13_21485 [Planctomycetia bacterium]|nr:hypothetical protein [Planctomycetia bacterium]